ncbi:hypothetical protein BOX15_Mlig034357g1 [Macrostomum lignano]|uniref:Uncharacterized protein n=1 Tax=Macrostomum lignano TaxID=282301 RepID=A0A267DK43_9PLAT|nr:hypothetical protein BOX15_Mlig034357g1 [Macrostomum lignano]
MDRLSLGFAGWLQTGEMEAVLEQTLCVNCLPITPAWTPKFCIVLVKFRLFFCFRTEEAAEQFLAAQSPPLALGWLARLDGGPAAFFRFWRSPSAGAGTDNDRCGLGWLEPFGEFRFFSG